jgi:hypothetical protein
MSDGFLWYVLAAFVGGGMMALITDSLIASAIGGILAPLGLYGAQAYDRSSEASGIAYESVAASTDCRLKPLIESALDDKYLSRGEYERIREREGELGFADSKGKALGSRMPRCTSRSAISKAVSIETEPVEAAAKSKESNQ